MTEEEKEWVNCEHLHNTVWRCVTWQPRSSWDHEHCRICMRRIAESNYGDPDAVENAYKYIYPREHEDEEERNEWLCRDCFDKYKGEFNWNALRAEISI